MSGLWVWLHDYIKGREAAERLPPIEYHEESHRLVVPIDGTPVAGDVVVRAGITPHAHSTNGPRKANDNEG